jgi:TolB-like protein
MQKSILFYIMARKKYFLMLLIFCFGLTWLCAQARLAQPNPMNATAGLGQAEIIINAERATRDIVVYLNSAVVAHLRPGTREKIIVQNGTYLLEAADTTAKGNNWTIGAKRNINIDANSNSVVIGMNLRYGTITSLAIESAGGLGGGGAVAAAAPAATPAIRAPTVPAGGGSIENAVIRAANVLVSNLPQNVTVAVLSIATNDPDMAEFVIEEIAYLIVSTNRFKVVDRKSLDAVQAEARFQYSGDVDDNSAVSIGKLLGANVVITGSISGSGSTRRLRAKALNVQTAEIMAMASEAY